MTRFVGALIIALLSSLVAAVPAAAGPPAAQSPGNCIGCGDESGTAVSASGGTFTGVQVIPGTGGSATPIGSVGGGPSSCPGCTFRLVSVCDFDNGCRETGGGGACEDPEETQYVVLATRPPAPEAVEGHVCLGPAEQPVPVEAITAAVERRLTDELIPTDAGVVVQPPGGALINVPTVVRADGARAPIAATFFAAGFSVRATAKPVRWAWTFGPGEERDFGYPGDAYASGVDPTISGRHATWTYTRAGARQLQVVVTWQAEYELAGVGTVPVGAVERPSPAVPLQVYASRSELVAG